ncbi:MAG: DedA family protein [Bradymonadaceae bacterium]
MESLQPYMHFLSGRAVWVGLVVLALSAAVEYVFPPFPGDLVTLAGSVMIPEAGWPIGGVFGALLVGTALGTSVDWRVGVWLSDNRDGESRLHQWFRRDHVQRRVDRLVDRFRRHGAVYISINRFVPAFRALFFVAAGYAGIDYRRAIGFGLLSACLWNAAVMGVGYAVGFHLETLVAIVRQYSTIALIAVGLAAAAWLVRTLWGASQSVE